MMAGAFTVAFIYDSRSLARSHGLSVDDCKEFDTEDTIEAMVQSIKACGCRVIPIDGIKQLASALAVGQWQEWDLAFPSAEGTYGAGREGQVSGLLEAYRIPHVFSDAATLSLSHDKGLTKMVLDHYRIPTPPYAVIPAPLFDRNQNLRGTIAEAIVRSHCAMGLTFPLFVKPACEGSSKGIHPFSKVKDKTQLEEAVRQLRARFPEQSLLVEKFLGGREFSVSILGTGWSSKVIGTAELDWKSAKSKDVRAEGYHTLGNRDYPGAEGDYPVKIVKAEDDVVVRRAEELALNAWRALGCRDVGRVDVRLTPEGPHDGQDEQYVLEVNAMPGMRPGWSTLCKTAEFYGMSHAQLIRAVIDSALQRYPQLKLNPPPEPIIVIE